MSTSTVTRLSVNINAETAQALKDLAEQRGTTVTEVIRRAVSVYKFIEDEVQDGKTLQLADKDKGEVTSLALVG